MPAALDVVAVAHPAAVVVALSVEVVNLGPAMVVTQPLAGDGPERVAGTDCDGPVPSGRGDGEGPLARDEGPACGGWFKSGFGGGRFRAVGAGGRGSDGCVGFDAVADGGVCLPVRRLAVEPLLGG